MEESRFKFIQDKVSALGCKLLTTNKDLFASMQKSNKSYQFQRVTFLSKCGHESDGFISNLTTKGTGINCKACSKEISSQKLRDNRLNPDVRSAQEIEYDGFLSFKQKLKSVL